MGIKTSLASLYAAAAIVATAAAATSLGWPDTIERLTQLRTQAQSCVDLLKSSGDMAAIRNGRIVCESAKAEADGVIAGLVAALVEGGKPERLTSLQADLGGAGAGLRETCDAAVKASSSAGGGTKGVVEDIARAAIEPVIAAIASGAGALWKQRVDRDALELATVKAQLEAAKWPDFGDGASTR